MNTHEDYDWDAAIAEAQHEWDLAQAQIEAEAEVEEDEVQPRSSNAEKAAGFGVLSVIFLPVAFLAGIDTYVTFGGFAAMLLWVKPWWWRQTTWEKSERGWGR